MGANHSHVQSHTNKHKGQETTAWLKHDYHSNRQLLLIKHDGKMISYNITLPWFSCKIKVALQGIWSFTLEIKQCMRHIVLIPTTLYAPGAPFHLISPQNWSQQSEKPNGTYCSLESCGKQNWTETTTADSNREIQWTLNWINLRQLKGQIKQRIMEEEWNPSLHLTSNSRKWDGIQRR